jgi:hypothetical protein
LQPFAAEIDPTRLSLLTVANAEMCIADEIDRRSWPRRQTAIPKSLGQWLRRWIAATVASGGDP